MTDQRTEILKRIKPSRDSEVVRKTKAWLLRSDTEPLSEKPVEVKVGEIRQLWRVRVAISAEKGHRLTGAQELLGTLDKLNPRVKLEQVGFTGSEHMGNVFFRKRTREYIGTVFF